MLHAIRNVDIVFINFLVKKLAKKNNKICSCIISKGISLIDDFVERITSLNIADIAKRVFF